MRFERFFLISAVLVVAFDAAASFASALLHFSYSYASFGSAAIYITLSCLATARFGFSRGIALGVLLALVDATAGWAVSWLIGPGRLAAGQFTFGAWALTLFVVVALGALCGLIGSGIGVLIRRSRAA